MTMVMLTLKVSFDGISQYVDEKWQCSLCNRDVDEYLLSGQRNGYDY